MIFSNKEILKILYHWKLPLTLTEFISSPNFTNTDVTVTVAIVSSIVFPLLIFISFDSSSNEGI